MRRGLRYAAAMGCLFLPAQLYSAPPPPDFNNYVRLAVDRLYADYKNGGYDLGSAFTHDLSYGSATIKKSSSAGPPAPSMCVAGVAEVIVTAIQLYTEKTGDKTPFVKAPAELWTRGNALSLRANIFMYKGTGSKGTADTLARFGMGETKPFKDLRPYDFVNFNRKSGSGHAVVFIGFLKADGTPLPNYGPDVAGFRYFSLQGKGKADAGFGYRDGYFEGACPANSPGHIRDCHIIMSKNPVLLNAGGMKMPSTWTVEAARTEMRKVASRAIELTNPGITKGLVDQELDQELPATISPNLDGVDGD